MNMRLAFHIFTIFSHLFLLAWILIALQRSGTWNSTIIFWNFAGISLYGALLIFSTAKISKYFHLKELMNKNKKFPKNKTTIQR
ncbi:MAG: hypothetical protein QE271_05200 [Bacteriovoracaceae bacterium]|nr:hypothetical protein [Bacteriovoracaceae bacterium]